jgi:hypothetical protein
MIFNVKLLREERTIASQYRIKEFSEYNLPKNYENTASGYCDDAKIVFGDDLQMYMLTSSCALGECIDGWSDVDFLIVTKELAFDSLRAIHEAQKKYDIRIALGALSLHEIHENMLSPEKDVIFYQLAEGMIMPNYVTDDPSFTLPRVSLEQIQQNGKKRLPELLHKTRRLLYEPSNDKRGIIKTLYSIEKILLESEGHNIIATSYSEAFEKFATEFGADSFDIMSEMLSQSSASEEFITYARCVVESICNGEIQLTPSSAASARPLAQSQKRPHYDQTSLRLSAAP